MNDERFEQLLGEIRQEQTPSTESVRDRVWQKLDAGGSSACEGFRIEFAEYLVGGLTEGRRLLIDDHLSRCPECRKSIAARRADPLVRAGRPRPAEAGQGAGRGPGGPPHSPWMRWAVAAGV